MKAPDPQLLTVRQVADLLAVSVRTVWTWTAKAEAGEGDFPTPLRLTPQIVRWRRCDIAAWLDGQAEAADAAARPRQEKTEIALT